MTGRNGESRFIGSWPSPSSGTLGSAMNASFTLKHMVTGQQSCSSTKPLLCLTQTNTCLPERQQQNPESRGHTKVKLNYTQAEKTTDTHSRDRDRETVTTFWTYPINLCSVGADSMIAFIFFIFVCDSYLLTPCLSLSLSLSLIRTAGPVSFSLSLPITYLLSYGICSPLPLLLFPLMYLLLWQILSSLLPTGLV